MADEIIEILAKHRARTFVEAQSEGEWGEDLIEKDSEALKKALLSFAEEYHGHKTTPPEA